MKLIHAFLIHAFLNIALASRAQQPVPTERALLWEISGKGLSAPSYLYGTIHMICPEDFSFSETLQKSFEASQQVYLEIDMDDPMMALKSAQLSLLKNGSIKELMTAADYEKLQRFMKDSIGMPMLLLNKMKPFTLMSMLYTKVLPCPKMESYEQRFTALAKKQQKEVLGLEKLEDQFAVFDRIPDSAEVRMILDMIDNFQEQRTEFAKMVDLYKRKDIDALANLISASPDMAGYEEVLLINRNKNWIPVMEKAMAAQRSFFAVGAGHLPGKQGVITLLREAGYTVRPVE